jgi:Zn ribbon nucleic-acid-binding protein
MINDDQSTKHQLTAADVNTGAIENGELPASEKRYADYYPASNEVCPRCQCADYQTVQDTKGRDMRQCISCELLYLPLNALCPRCQSADYQPIKGVKGQDMRQCKNCGQHYLLREDDL